jgi:ZIP family zinc transporter
MEALLWGFVAAVSLLLGAGLALRIKFSRKAIGLVMAFGAGALISSVAFELIDESFNTSHGLAIVGIGIATGALVYYFGDRIIENMGGRHHRRDTKKKDNSGVAILLGTIIDGIPESAVIGLSLAGGQPVGVAMVVAVFLSNIPEAMSSSVGLKRNGWKPMTIIGLWAVIVLVSALSAWAGYAIFGTASPLLQAFILAFAGGAILTMLANSMMPEAYRDSGKTTGLVVVLGFCVAFAVTTLE